MMGSGLPNSVGSLFNISTQALDCLNGKDVVIRSVVSGMETSTVMLVANQKTNVYTHGCRLR